MRWIVIAITVNKKTILFPCGGLRGARAMIEILLWSILIYLIGGTIILFAWAYYKGYFN